MNKELIVENQKLPSLKAQRVTNQGVKDVGGIGNIKIDKHMPTYPSNARYQFRAHLEEVAAAKETNKVASK